MNTPEDLHIMVDIETLSNDTRTGVMLAIGAVAFIVRQDIEPPSSGEYLIATSGNMFYLPIHLVGQKQYGLCVEPETVKWWMDDEIRLDLLINNYMASQYARPIKETFEIFAQWIKVFGSDRKLSLWSHGVTYDCVHLAEKWPMIIGASFNTVCPFRQMRDTRTLFAMFEAKYGMTPYPAESKYHAMKHHPLYDAYIQAVATQRALRAFLEEREDK